MTFTGRPNPELAPAYAAYYFDLTVQYTDLLEALEENRLKFLKLIQEIPNSKADFQYADDKWSLKNVILHTIETERVFQYRALAISRNDQNELPSFDENAYADNNNVYSRSLADLAEEFDFVRKSTIALFRGMTEKMLDRTGTANGSPYSTRNLGWVIVGHTMHHTNIIVQRYLVDFEEN